MTSTITFNDTATFNSALTVLELDSTPPYDVDGETIIVYNDDVHDLVDILHENNIAFKVTSDEDVEYDQFRHDGEADADALRSAGYDDEENYCPSIDSFGED